MRERALRFGVQTPLVGVLTEPAGAPDPSRPAVVFLNSGILHHVGACRLHVRLARRLAHSGFTSLRFDLSGLGDSEVRKDSLPFEKSAPVEVCEALDHLKKARGIERFILVGLCSGADMAFKAGLLDPRVIGLAQLDAYAYRTTGYYLRYYVPRVTSLRTWRNYIARKLRRPADGEGKSSQPPGDDYVRAEYRRRFPPRAEVQAGLRALVGRGVELLFLFSGGQPDHYNHQGQYRRSFPQVDFQNRLQVEYMGEADHLFSALEHQRIVDGLIHDWVVRIGDDDPEAIRDRSAVGLAQPALGRPAVKAVPVPA